MATSMETSMESSEFGQTVQIEYQGQTFSFFLGAISKEVSSQVIHPHWQSIFGAFQLQANPSEVSKLYFVFSPQSSPIHLSIFDLYYHAATLRSPCKYELRYNSSTRKL